MSAAAVSAVGLSVTLGSTRIVDSLDLTVARGEWVGLLGPNGAGKSTLLRALAGLIDADGKIVLDGRIHQGRRRRELARAVALVPQNPQIPAALTVAEYVLLGRTPHISYLGSEGAADRAAATAAIDRLGLRALASVTLGRLSGGEQQRVVIARALAQQAPLLLLDEPTSSLDLGHQQQALELVDELRRADGLTVISAMHDLSLAGQYPDRLVVLADGAVIAAGQAADVLTPELIVTCFGAQVRVLHEGGRVFVLPQRLAPRG